MISRNVIQTWPNVPWGNKINLPHSLSLPTLNPPPAIHIPMENHWVSWMNQGIWQTNIDKLRSKFVFPYLLPVSSSWARNLNPSETKFPHWYGEMDGIHEPGGGKPPKSSIRQSMEVVILICVLNPASPPQTSLWRPRARTGCSHFPRVWKEGELEFHPS